MTRKPPPKLCLVCDECSKEYWIGLYWHRKRLASGSRALCWGCSLSVRARRRWSEKGKAPRNEALVPENAIRVEWITLSNGRNTRRFWFRCAAPDCSNEIRVTTGQSRARTGYCRRCIKRPPYAPVGFARSRGQPYAWLYTVLSANARVRSVSVDFSVQEFCEMIQSPGFSECAYCGVALSRAPHYAKRGVSQAYCLDRIDNAKGYALDNCLPCCTSCNLTRGDRFTHEEFSLLSAGLRTIQRQRAAMAKSRGETTEYQ